MVLRIPRDTRKGTRSIAVVSVVNEAIAVGSPIQSVSTMRIASRDAISVATRTGAPARCAAWNFSNQVARLFLAVPRVPPVSGGLSARKRRRTSDQSLSTDRQKLYIPPAVRSIPANIVRSVRNVIPRSVATRASGGHYAEAVHGACKRGNPISSALGVASSTINAHRARFIMFITFWNVRESSVGKNHRLRRISFANWRMWRDLTESRDYL